MQYELEGIKARFAPIIPPAYLPLFKAQWGAQFGDYHLVLAHEVLQYPELFSDLFAKRANGFVILDNGVVETGKALPAAQLKQAYDIVRANCVVVPDVLNDYDATLRLASAFAEDIKKQGLQDMTHCQMLVLQGGSYEELDACIQGYKRLGFDIGGRHILAVPRAMRANFGSRAIVVDWIRAHYGAVQTKIHLLGMSSDILDDIATARMPGVVGIDSSAPWFYMLRDEMIDISPRSRFSRQPKDWDSQRIGQLSADQWELFCRNVMRVRNWIARG